MLCVRVGFRIEGLGFWPQGLRLSCELDRAESDSIDSIDEGCMSCADDFSPKLAAKLCLY